MDTAERERAARRLFWSTWRGAFVGNTVAAITFGTMLAVSVRVYAPEFPYARLMWQFVLVGTAVVPPTIVGTLIAGKWLIRRRMEWFLEDRRPPRRRSCVDSLRCRVK